MRTGPSWADRTRRVQDSFLSSLDCALHRSVSQHWLAVRLILAIETISGGRPLRLLGLETVPDCSRGHVEGETKWKCLVGDEDRGGASEPQVVRRRSPSPPPCTARPHRWETGLYAASSFALRRTLLTLRAHRVPLPVARHFQHATELFDHTMLSRHLTHCTCITRIRHSPATT